MRRQQFGHRGERPPRAKTGVKARNFRFGIWISMGAAAAVRKPGRCHFLAHFGEIGGRREAAYRTVSKL